MSKELRLSDVLARTVEVGDCLEWTGHANAGKFPQWRIAGVLRPARRVIWELVKGPIQPGMQIGVKCGCALCVHPDHLVSRSRAKAQTGRVVTPAHKAKMAAAKRVGSILTMDIARAIRASDEPGPVIEQRYGLRPGYASRIRTGRVWADMSSPFAGLGARG